MLPTVMGLTTDGRDGVRIGLIRAIRHLSVKSVVKSTCAGGLAFVALLLAGCTHAPLNQPLTKYDQRAGFRYKPRPAAAGEAEVVVLLFFSGGGMRAAALSYGVLRELAATQVIAASGSHRLLDDVEIISSVSGGSFTAAYYALNRDRTFTDFEPRFLKRDIHGALVSRLFFPAQWPNLASDYYGRSDLAADYYDRKVFDKATFGDLVRAGNRPLLLINATDMANGEQFAFSQVRFDLIGSDLSTFPLARAVAASSATPLLLTPITLQNHAGKPGAVQSAFLPPSVDEAALPERTREIRRAFRSYTDAQERPFIHLVDGGLSDNLGLRGIMDAALLNGGISGLAERIGMPVARRFVVVVVNAATRRGAEWTKREDVPGIWRSIDQLGDNVGQQVNRHTLELFRQLLDDWRSEARHRFAMQPEPGRDAPDYYLVNLSFDQLAEADERQFLQNLPTRLSLPPETIDRLTAAGGQLLRESPEFRRLLDETAAEAARTRAR
jgi:NTE family protein